MFGRLRNPKDCFVVPPRNDDPFFLKLVGKFNKCAFFFHLSLKKDPSV
jgi:hypothetical protein